MAKEIYVFHPGAGISRSLDGSLRTKEEGSNIAYIQQRYVNGTNRRSYYHGALVPPDIDVTQNIIVRVVFRQLTSGAGNAYVDVAFNNINPPTDRDSALTSIGAQAIAMPGTIGQEVAQEYTIAAGTFAANEELIFCIERQAWGGAFSVGCLQALGLQIFSWYASRRDNGHG